MDNGGPAFPGLHPSKECRYNDPGMTLRDYFAAKAITGLIASTPYDRVLNPAGVAQEAYAVADAMLKAREKNHG